MKKQNSIQSGFTLIELLIALFILGLIAAVVVPNFSGDKTKGQVLNSTMQETGQALIRMHLDTGCYPNRLDTLFEQSLNTAANNMCGVDTTAQWQGPYISPVPVNTSGLMTIDNIAAGATIGIGSVAGGIGTEYFLIASNVPNSIVHDAVLACNGTDNTGTVTFGLGAGVSALAKCEGTVGTSVGTFSYMFDETK
ncbi:MAG: prepilin-type N-terminal cleavage/methylation domain-containing protein [Pseudomonadota bacterium]|nr:prepilin-type N-terminal cleavage/methylation domain-containing protein [Pseudomonadota bacterium]